MNFKLKTLRSRFKRKTHKGLSKRLVVRSNDFEVKRIGINKYASKRSSRNRSYRRRTNLITVPAFYKRIIRRLL